MVDNKKNKLFFIFDRHVANTLHVCGFPVQKVIFDKDFNTAWGFENTPEFMKELLRIKKL